MHPFTTLGEFAPLVGDEIAQVMLDPYSVQFAFVSGARLLAQEPVQHIEADGAEWIYTCEGDRGPPNVLHRLLYKPVTAIERENRALTFVLSDGSRFIVTSESEQYESGSLTTPAGGWVIF